MGDGRPNKTLFESAQDGARRALADHYRNIGDETAAEKAQSREFNGLALIIALFIGISGLAIAYLW